MYTLFQDAKGFLHSSCSFAPHVCDRDLASAQPLYAHDLLVTGDDVESIITPFHTARFPVAVPAPCCAINVLRVVRNTENKRFHGPLDRHAHCARAVVAGQWCDVHVEDGVREGERAERLREICRTREHDQRVRDQKPRAHDSRAPDCDRARRTGGLRESRTGDELRGRIRRKLKRQHSRRLRVLAGMQVDEAELECDAPWLERAVRRPDIDCGAGGQVPAAFVVLCRRLLRIAGRQSANAHLAGPVIRAVLDDLLVVVSLKASKSACCTRRAGDPDGNRPQLPGNGVVCRLRSQLAFHQRTHSWHPTELAGRTK
jgi:hypothetical protein